MGTSVTSNCSMVTMSEPGLAGGLSNGLRVDQRHDDRAQASGSEQTRLGFRAWVCWVIRAR
jgi:hypothetical protein